MSDLHDRLQTALGGTYHLDSELGGGGMSRVFLATETDLDRKVVIKVLPPEMAAGVNKERFQREIRLAASLQHPHIVPLLTAGTAAEDLLYYVMPYIEGESLRAKLNRHGELPVGQSVQLLKEIMDALAYAHEHGVVHRDIKPDNILLSGDHALVTDFGVAKAVTASSGSSSLTSLGVALGTPAYMSPEQAAADPHVDHRSDIYAVGALAYEMLTGQPPFTGATPQQVLAAHVSQMPDPVTIRRHTIPPAVGDLIMRCLAKRAADRWQTAAELKTTLAAMVTPSGGMTPTATEPVDAVSISAAERAMRSAHPVRVAALFGAAAAGLLIVVYGLMIALGLPDWVFVGAIALLAIGLPIMLVTGKHERQRAAAVTTGLQVTGPVGLERHFTWRKALVGGGAAFAGLTVAAGGFMAMRASGIGPAATLVTAGLLEGSEPVILAEFANRTGDSTLGPSVTDAFRVDLSQSAVVRLLDESNLTDALARMGRDPTAPIDAAVAREIAQREGVKAIVTGEIGPVGSGYVLSATVVSAADGNALAAVRETAADDGEIITAVDALSATLRERIGESLRTIRANPPLERVSTGSVEALRKYSQAIRAEQAGDRPRAVSLLREATAIDPAFAMAYRKEAVILSNIGAPASEVMHAASRAFEHRDRLAERERYLTIAYYHETMDRDRTRVIDAYRSVLEIDSLDRTALNNLALRLNQSRDWDEAELLTRRGLAHHNIYSLYTHLLVALVAQGKYGAADSAMDRMAETRGPLDPYVLRGRGWIAAVQADYASADAYLDSLGAGADGAWEDYVSNMRSRYATIGGRIERARQLFEGRMEGAAQRGEGGSYLDEAVRRARVDLEIREQPASAVASVEEALRRIPLRTIPSVDRPYLALITLFADAGRVDDAVRLMTEYETEVPETFRRGESGRLAAAGAIALAEGRIDEAIASYRAFVASPRNCVRCGMDRLGQLYDRAGQRDSALAVYERGVTADDLMRPWAWTRTLAPTYRRLGELYEEDGNHERALQYYDLFVETWTSADDDLQPMVADVRSRMARLAGESPR